MYHKSRVVHEMGFRYNSVCDTTEKWQIKIGKHILPFTKDISSPCLLSVSSIFKYINLSLLRNLPVATVI